MAMRFPFTRQAKISSPCLQRFQLVQWAWQPSQWCLQLLTHSQGMERNTFFSSLQTPEPGWNNFLHSPKWRTPLHNSEHTCTLKRTATYQPREWGRDSLNSRGRVRQSNGTVGTNCARLGLKNASKIKTAKRQKLKCENKSNHSETVVSALKICDEGTPPEKRSGRWVFQTPAQNDLHASQCTTKNLRKSDWEQLPSKKFFWERY